MYIPWSHENLGNRVPRDIVIAGIRFSICTKVSLYFRRLNSEAFRTNQMADIRGNNPEIDALSSRMPS